MSAKRKSNPGQPELPIEEVPENTPGAVHAAPAPKSASAKPPKATPEKNGNGNGAPHVLAEDVAPNHLLVSDYAKYF